MYVASSADTIEADLEPSPLKRLPQACTGGLHVMHVNGLA